MNHENNKRSQFGIVYLVGAGPGEETLITVRGKELIEEADCIVYDHLANPALLRFAKAGCEMIYVGKENSRHTMEQEEINVLLTAKAGYHEKVVRLKGGDPYVFGRGGEEGIYLKEHGVPFEVVPGISSVIAGLAYGGIPITHRGISRGFRVITAHQQDGRPADIDYNVLAGTKDTCVFLMGFRKLREIVEGLLGAGKSPDCPAAVICSATLPSQRTCVGTLETIVEKTKRACMEPPALIVVGQAVSLRPFLNFFEEKPLYGKRFLVTKIGTEISELTKGLQELGAFVTEIQTGEIRNFTGEVTREMLLRPGWIVLTSRHGAEAFFESLKCQIIDFRLLGSQKFAVVGRETAKVLENYGFYPDLVPSCFDSETLAGELEQAVKPGERILYGVPRGVEHEELLRLKENYDVLEVCLYENRECKFSVPEITYDGALFTCASSVKRFFCHLSENQQADFRSGRTEAVSIGKSTTKALNDFGAGKIRQASCATYQNMLSALVSP